VLNIASSAQQRFLEILDNRPGKIIRIEITSGGCNGFRKDIRVDDPQIDDITIPIGNRFLAMDPMTSDLLSSSTIDWISGFAGSHFDIKVAEATSSCGCGESFSL
jgi:iron-sulfur cluster insertion protein